jgi:RimJ/RimL family protein N-acetyltransferase
MHAFNQRDRVASIQDAKRACIPAPGGFPERCGERAEQMHDRQRPELKVFHPRRKTPLARSNLTLEGYLRGVVSRSSRDDLLMRFFGLPDTEAIPGRVTGRIADHHEQPRDAVVVAFVNRRPVGYTDVARFSAHPETAEFSMLVRTDMQRRGIGQAMLQEAVRVLREEGVTHLRACIHPDNTNMQHALEKWSQAQELRGVTFRRFAEDGTLVYVLDLQAQPS